MKMTAGRGDSALNPINIVAHFRTGKFIQIPFLPERAFVFSLVVPLWVRLQMEIG